MYISKEQFIELAKKAGLKIRVKKGDDPRVNIKAKGANFSVGAPIGEKIWVSEDGIASVFTGLQVWTPDGTEEDPGLKAHHQELEKCKQKWAEEFKKIKK